MEEISTDWLREHMAQHIANHSLIEPTDNILDFRSRSSSLTDRGDAILALVYQAADLIGEIEHRATEKHARAKALADQAAEKVEAANDRINFVESARRSAEAELNDYKGRTETLGAKIAEIEKMADERVRSAELARHAAEAELCECKGRMERLAANVKEIEKAVKQAATNSVTTQAELAAAKQRAINAEMRANEAERILKHIDAAIRTQILDKTLCETGSNVVRAA